MNNPNVKNRRVMFAALAGSIFAVVFSGCATITKSDSQPVAFSSEPQGATVSLNGVPRGTTPVTIMVEKHYGDQMVMFQKDGYRVEQFKVEKHVAGMTFGNIIFGGIIGVGVDIATGKAMTYQDSIQVRLGPLEKEKSAPTVADTSRPASSVSAPLHDISGQPPATTPPQNDSHTTFKNHLGLTVSNELLVIDVLPESAAAYAAIQKGDQICSYNGMPDKASGATEMPSVASAINAPLMNQATITWRAKDGPAKTASLMW